jgi:hypothetical protein
MEDDKKYFKETADIMDSIRYFFSPLINNIQEAKPLKKRRMKIARKFKKKLSENCIKHFNAKFFGDQVSIVFDKEEENENR